MPHPLAPADDTAIDPTADLSAILPRAARWTTSLPLPGGGRTSDLWRSVADLSAVDVELARIVEPHLDATAILAQAEGAGADLASLRASLGVTSESTWGVYAAEGAGTRLVAAEAPGGWSLSGTKPWCSLAAHLSHALVTAWVSEDERGLFAVDLRAPGVRPHAGPWESRGLTRVVSAPVDFAAVPAVPVGDPGWYLRRPGFSWGGIGVAAVWAGGARPLVAALAAAARSPRADQLAQMYAGEADAALWQATLALDHAAAAVDAGATGDAAKLLAARVRAVVAEAVETILSLADRALGPGPLTADAAHAKRVADLRIYVRQHHGERDAARLGRLAAGA